MHNLFSKTIFLKVWMLLFCYKDNILIYWHMASSRMFQSMNGVSRAKWCSLSMNLPSVWINLNAKWSLVQSLLLVVFWNVGVLQKSGRQLSFLLLGILISSSSWGDEGEGEGGSMLVIGSDVMPGVKTQIRSASLAKDRGICHDRLWTAVWTN